MRTFYRAEVASPCGGRPVVVESPWLDKLDAAIDLALGVACDNAGREMGALGTGRAASSPMSTPAFAGVPYQRAHRIGGLRP